jgi:hypothetical protein
MTTTCAEYSKVTFITITNPAHTYRWTRTHQIFAQSNQVSRNGSFRFDKSLDCTIDMSDEPHRPSKKSMISHRRARRTRNSYNLTFTPTCPQDISAVVHRFPFCSGFTPDGILAKDRSYYTSVMKPRLRCPMAILMVGSLRFGKMFTAGTKSQSNRRSSL